MRLLRLWPANDERRVSLQKTVRGFNQLLNNVGLREDIQLAMPVGSVVVPIEARAIILLGKLSDICPDFSTPQ
jgi:hypothetical protein